MILAAHKIAFFDRYVGGLIAEKYGISDREAVRMFIGSETYKMLIDAETELYKASQHIIFDMWEVEKITGEPRNSQYIRE